MPPNPAAGPGVLFNTCSSPAARQLFRHAEGEASPPQPHLLVGLLKAGLLGDGQRAHGVPAVAKLLQLHFDPGGVVASRLHELAGRALQCLDAARPLAQLLLEGLLPWQPHTSSGNEPPDLQPPDLSHLHFTERLPAPRQKMSVPFSLPKNSTHLKPGAHLATGPYRIQLLTYHLSIDEIYSL